MPYGRVNVGGINLKTNLDIKNDKFDVDLSNDEIIYKFDKANSVFFIKNGTKGKDDFRLGYRASAGVEFPVKIYINSNEVFYDRPEELYIDAMGVLNHENKLYFFLNATYWEKKEPINIFKEISDKFVNNITFKYLGGQFNNMTFNGKIYSIKY